MTFYRQPSRRQRSTRLLPRPDSPGSVLLSPLFATSRDALLLIDSKHRLRELNAAACRLLGVSAASACGRPWRQVFTLERDPSLGWRHQPVTQCLQARRDQPVAPGTCLVQGERRQFLQGKVLALQGGKRPLALLCLETPESAGNAVTLPASEHQLLLQHMSRLNTVSELAAGIAHEMNQPLAAIMGFNQAALRLLEEESPDLAQISGALADAVRQTQRAAGVLQRLRAFVGRQPLQAEVVAINQVVVNALTLLSNHLVANGIRVSLHTDPCPPVCADALQLEQVMVNLVRNAIDAMQATRPEARVLHIATHPRNGRVQVSVTDSGPGLPATVLDRLFTRFFTTKDSGMGLGLSISRSIVEAAGGELRAGNAPGAGACFRFSLPALLTEEFSHAAPI